MAKRHSRSVYMRRRILVLAIVLTPILLAVRLLGGGSAAPATSGPTANPSVGASASAAPSTADTGTVTSASASPVASAIHTTPAPIASLTGPLKADTHTATPKASRTPTLPDCKDASIGINVTTDATTYPVGNPVTIAMRISNTGTTDCMRDIGSLPNEVWVTDANGVVIWTSDACQASASSQVVDLTPGRTFGNTQVWNGTNSGRTCTTTASPAPAGSYVAYARNDRVTSQGYAFTIG